MVYLLVATYTLLRRLTAYMIKWFVYGLDVHILRRLTAVLPLLYTYCHSHKPVLGMHRSQWTI